MKQEKYLFISDLQIPDENKQALEALYKFIPDYKADKFMIVGDFFNCTGVSSFTSPDYYIDLQGELEQGTKILQKLVLLARKANPNVKITWFDGNHEYRLLKYLASHAGALQRLQINGEKMISLPYILGFKELGIKYQPYMSYIKEHEVIITHGDVARKFSGYTEKGMIDTYGQSGISGHTHRPAFVTRKIGERQLFWMGLGCLCNLTPTPTYMVTTDWQNSFGVATYTNGTFYPELIPIYNNSFVYGGKHYGRTSTNSRQIDRS